MDYVWYHEFFPAWTLSILMPLRNSILVSIILATVVPRLLRSIDREGGYRGSAESRFADAATIAVAGGKFKQNKSPAQEKSASQKDDPAVEKKD